METAPLAAFSAPTRIVAGLGALADLGEHAEALGKGPIAVVVDRGVAEGGLLDRVLGHLGRADAVVVAQVAPDPSIAAAEAASAEARARACTSVLMLGGGSALGVGKAVALRLSNDVPIAEMEGRDRARCVPAPSLAIPTTAGSGSEVSNALVLHDESLDRLVVVRGAGYEPDVAILDGEILTSLPERPMLYAGLDAHSHALEALWARGGSAITNALAVGAATAIRTTLPRALRQRTLADLQTLLEASAMANLACGSAGLGLVHALSSASNVHVPHGLQNGVLLAHVAVFNRSAVGSAARVEIDALEELYEELGFEPRFDPDDLPPDAGDSMITAALGNPFHANNLRHADVAELGTILKSAGVPVAAPAAR